MTNETALAVTKPAFTDVESFEFAQRAAKLLSISDMVPKELRNNIPNCVIVLNLAARMGVDPMMVGQNIVIVNGRPGWRSQFLIACFNVTNKYSTLRYEWRGEEGQDDWGCRAWCYEKGYTEKLYGAWVTMTMAKKEGWIKNLKWQSMPELMLMYRSAAFHIRVYAPEIANGLHTAEEVADFTSVEVIQPPTIDDDGMIFDPETGEILKLDRPQSDTEAEFFEAEVVE